MILTDTEHPPAAGTALGVAVQGFSIDVVVAVVMSTIVLSIIARLCFTAKFGLSYKYDKNDKALY